MVVVSPLLADLIRHGLASRIDAVTVAEFSDLQDACTRLRDIDADVVIVGPSAPQVDAALIRPIVPRAQVLTVAADLSQIVDLDTGEAAPFTPGALADRLRR
jgi:hypothetical protein